MMKKIIFCALALLVAAGAAYGQKKSVAVAPTLGKAVNDEIKSAIQGALEEGIHKSGSYRLLARDAGYQQALREFKFQQESGAVSDDQLKMFGKSAGADFVCYAQISKLSEKSFRISYKLVHVESGEIPVVDSKSVRTGVEGLMDAMDAIAEEMFGGSGNSRGGGSATQRGGSSAAASRQRPAEPEMVYVEGGTFWMGCTTEQQGSCAGDESPLHSVTLTGFSIGKYEVTQAQWKLIMGSNPSKFSGDNLPVENVSWNDVQEFIERLNAATGKQYRLPTEAEWEYAARGGAKSRGYKYSGSHNLSNVAWFEDNSGSRTHPVGAKLPNELGIHDMSGNVWEWCSDWKGGYPASAQHNPMGAGSSSWRVLRGGSWSHTAARCRVSYRSNSGPGYRSYLGFRVALP